jgi:hypothetical protein
LTPPVNFDDFVVQPRVVLAVANASSSPQLAPAWAFNQKWPSR